jgi:hypothetical protein
MAELTAGQKEINRKLAEAGLPPRFPESSGDETTPKTPAGLKDLGAQLLRDGAKAFAANKKLTAAAIGGPLSPAILDSGKPPTPDKTFYDNLDTTFSAVLGGPAIPPKYGGTELAEAADKLPKQSDFVPLFGDDKPKEFGTSMGSRSGSSLSGSANRLGAKGTLGESRTLGTESGAMRTEARRLRNQGYGKEAGQMALAASMQRLNDPRILTQAQRGRMSAQAKQGDMAAEEAKALQGEQTDYMRKLIKARQKQLDEGVLPPYPMGQATAGATSNFFS